MELLDPLMGRTGKSVGSETVEAYILQHRHLGIHNTLENSRE